MPIRSARKKIIFSLTAIGLVAAVGIGLLRHWQGPAVQGYLVRSTPLVQSVVASGRVASLDRARISSETTGVVVERLVEEGDRVQPGDLLLVLRDEASLAQVHQAETALDQLASARRPQARLSLERAEEQLQQALRESARRKALLERALLTQEALEQAEQAEILARNTVAAASLVVAELAEAGVEEALLQERLSAARSELSKTRIRAESAGTLLGREVEIGDLVQPGRVLFVLALDGTTELLVPVDEKNLSLLAIDQRAMAVADAFPDRPFAARVDWIAPRIDPQRGTVDLHLVVEPAPDFLRQDMTVSVTIQTGQREQALVLPNDALGEVLESRASVWQVRDGHLEETSVTLGLRGLSHSEILDGLGVGDAVLVPGNAELESGARVRFETLAWPAAASSSSSNSDGEVPVRFD